MWAAALRFLPLLAAAAALDLDSAAHALRVGGDPAPLMEVMQTRAHADRVAACAATAHAQDPQWWAAQVAVCAYEQRALQPLRALEAVVSSPQAQAVLAAGVGTTLAAGGDAAAGAAALRRSVQLHPKPVAYNNLIATLVGAGQLREAAAAMTACIRQLGGDAMPTGTVAKLALDVLDAEGDVQTASALLAAQHLARRHPNASYPAGYVPYSYPGGYGPRGTFQDTTALKLAQDREQLEFVLARHPAEAGWLRGVDPARLVNRALWVPPAPARPAGGVLNEHLDWAAIEQAYYDSGRQLLVVDNVLRQDVLQEVHELLLESTVFHEVKRGGSYLGAYVDDGLHAELLLQIAVELRRHMPRVIAHHALKQMWAYRYAGGSERSGIGLHADSCAINGNLWISPSIGNRDPETGGLVVYPTAPPDHWGYMKHNALASEVGLEEQLIEAGGRVRIPFAQNRLVLFNSIMFHRTDDLDFRPDYKSRRINLTMLFGERADGTGLPMLDVSKGAARRIEELEVSGDTMGVA